MRDKGILSDFCNSDELEENMPFKGVPGFEWRKSSVQKNDCNKFEFWGISCQVYTDIQTSLKCFKLIRGVSEVWCCYNL